MVYISKCPLFSLVAVFFLTGVSQKLFGQMLYIGNAGDRTISAYVIDQESGLLTEVRPRVADPGSPQSLAVHPSGKFVYVANAGGGVGPPNLAAFSIDAGSGALTLLNSSPLTLGSGPQAVAIDPSGNFAFVAQQGANYVSAFTIDPATGATSAIPGSPFATPQAPSSVVVHPNGKFAYVSAAGAGQIAAFNIAANGALTPADGSPFAARNNLLWMTMDAAGKFLFAVERQDNAVLVYSVNSATGALTQVGSPVPAGPGVSGIAVDPAGRFLYVTTVGIGGVSVFNIGATGALTQRRMFGAVIGAFAAILDPSGKFLYVPGQQANAVAGLAIDADSGALTPLPQQFFPAGAQPQRGATVLLTPPVIPPISADAVYNFFSNAPPGMPNAGIAQGSRLAISGRNIGPAVGVAASDYPLTNELGGTSVQIQSGDVITSAIMFFASNNFVTCVVPSTTPLGDATVTVTYKGRTTAPLPIKVVTTSVGIRTLNSQGNGPAKAFNTTPDTALSQDSTPPPSNALNQPAKPGQWMVVQATGLGPVGFDETQNLSQEMDVPADVIVGNKLATVRTKLRVVTGNDYILFKLPDDAPEGCYVPIAIRAGGVMSNVASVSISASGGSCSDATGLAASDIETAQKSGQLNMASIQLTHLDLGPLGLDNEVTGSFARYDFNTLLTAFAPGVTQSAIRKSLGTPAVGSCTVTPGSPTVRNRLFDVPPDRTFGQFLNVGQALNVSGPLGTVPLLAPDYSFNSDTNVITPGDYTVDNGTGTQAFGPFKATLTLPPMLTWTNKDAVVSPDRTQDLTVTWSGGIPDKEFVLIVGLAVSEQATAAFLCTEKVSASKFSVPAWVLSSLPRSAMFTEGGQSLPGGLLAVGTAPLTSVGRFTAPGFDFGVFTYEQATLNLVNYQ